MSNWYKLLVANLTLAQVMPELAHDTEVCRLDAERERLANEYEAADGALLNRIADYIRHDGSGRWSRYVTYHGIPDPDAELPDLLHDVEVCRLDAERVQLLSDYLTADRHVRDQIATRLRNDGTGRWSRYRHARVIQGGTTPHDRMRLAIGQDVAVVRWDRGAVFKFTHCPECRLLLSKCECVYEEWARQDREAQDGKEAS